MTRDEAISQFSALGPDRQIAVLASYGHLLTVYARDTYVAGTDDVERPRELRHSNEILHRVLAHIWHLANGNAKRYPDDVLISILWADYELMAKSSQQALSEALTKWA